jgi:hypothetical protein
VGGAVQSMLNQPKCIQCSPPAALSSPQRYKVYVPIKKHARYAQSEALLVLVACEPGLRMCFYGPCGLSADFSDSLGLRLAGKKQQKGSPTRGSNPQP